MSSDSVVRWAHATVRITKSNDEGIIEGVASTPTPDSVGDIMDPDGAQFQLPMPLLWQHDAAQPIGQVLQARVSGAGISIRARIAHEVHAEIARVWALVKAGLARGLSIGFCPGETTRLPGGGTRFHRWMWQELSVVTLPANAEATIATVKSADRAVLRSLGLLPVKPRVSLAEAQAGRALKVAAARLASYPSALSPEEQRAFVTGRSLELVLREIGESANRLARRVSAIEDELRRRL